MKRKPDKVLRHGLKLQINYLKGNIKTINWLLDKIVDGSVPFDKHQSKYFFVIQQVLAQQESMFKDKSNSCEDRIVNIHHTGDPLGRKPVKTVMPAYMRRKERREAAERNKIEGKFGQGKNGYNLNQIRAKLFSTSMSWIAAIVFVTNVIRYARDFSGSFLKWLFANVMKMRG